MGLGKFLLKTAFPIYHAVDTVKKMNEHGIVDGYKEATKELWLDDAPVVSHVYKAGKVEGHYQGKKDGYVEASNEYEKKLLAQADSFLRQNSIFEGEKAEYDALLLAYEKHIEKMESSVSSNSKEEEYMNSLILAERKLKKLRK